MSRRADHPGSSDRGGHRGLDTAAEAFEANRARLFGIAYGMIGEIMDAEDLVQDAYLRWRAADTAAVDNPAGFLTTIITRLAIDRLRSARHRREHYIGPWLPDPIVSGERGPDDVVAEAEQLSLALLVALERLNPVERAVFLLRDVFDLDYQVLATMVDRSPANCRQIAARARDRVGDTSRSFPSTPERGRQLVEAFVAALSRGDVDSLAAMLAADVVFWSDGGGAARSALQPIVGLHRVTRFLMGVSRKVKPATRLGFTTVNGDPALLIMADDRPWQLIAFEFVDDRIIGIRNQMNPAKLALIPVVDTPFEA